MEESKEQLKVFFKEIGCYDLRFYSAHYWLNRLSVEKSLRDILDESPVEPHQNHKAVDLLNECANKEYKLIALSATHLEFIDIELDGLHKYFVDVYSCIDDFETAGKPDSIYDKIVEKLEISSRELCNIGDNKEMDVDNARSAGCQAMLWPDEFITISR